ncbi:MAG: ATP-dependent helicase [Candidatus Gastranaerophilaceae bacterium]
MEQVLKTSTVIKPNERQQEAIDRLNGQIMLLAGPGTGKTFTIINRIEQMLLKGIKASSILCLTFSDAAAMEMRQRLIKKMGVKASAVNVFTYHSFCNEIIKEYPQQFELSVGVRLITETEKIELMKESIDEAQLKTFIPTRGDKYYFTKNFINYVEHLKSLRITKDEYLACLDSNPTLRQRIKELESEIYEREQQGKTQNKGRYAEIEKIKSNIEKACELWTLFEIYSNKMVSNNLIDFSDMICFVLRAFEEDEVFKKEVSSKFEHFLVDEYQDTNTLQNEIIFNLVDSNSQKNIFVVGDDDQIIYGFQGAKSDNIEKFLKKYSETKVICLEENNRSTQTILDFSYKVVSQDTSRLENNDLFKNYNITKKLTAKNKKIIEHNQRIKRWQFGETLQEFNKIVEDITNLINSDKCPLKEDNSKDLSQIAIIGKKRTELQTFAELLKAKNIPCQIDEGKSIFSIRSSILIYFYIKVLTNFIKSSDKQFGLLLADPFKLDLKDYNYLLKQTGVTQLDFISLMRQNNKWNNAERIKNFLDTLDYLQEYAQSNNLRNTIVEIINRTGILKAFYKNTKNRSENLLGIKKFIDEATQYSKLDTTKCLLDFVQYLDDCIKNEIDLCIDKDSMIQNAIQLTTYHGSKGREFDYVYLPNLVSKNWENFKMPGEYKFITDEVLDPEIAQQKKDSELLKLLFVGITRAKYGLTISFADECEGKSQQITKYLSELMDYEFDSEQFEYNDDEFYHEFFRAISRDVFDNQKEFENTIKENVKKIELSPSRLNDYLTCPRKFFYLKVLGIYVEEVDWDNANFGTIMHKLLENSAKEAKKTNAYPSIDTIKKEFYELINATKFSGEEFKEKFEKLGINAIEKYYPHFCEIPTSRIVDVEHKLEGIDVDGDFITGTIDRIEINSDGSYQLYDYKTGKSTSESKIAIGNDKENYFNQLCFYKYAFEKQTGKKVSTTGIIYIEDNKTIEKVLTDEDMTYIENKIKETYANIKALKFNPIKEDKNGACKFCAYKQLCKLDLI